MAIYRTTIALLAILSSAQIAYAGTATTTAASTTPSTTPSTTTSSSQPTITVCLGTVTDTCQGRNCANDDGCCDGAYCANFATNGSGTCLQTNFPCTTSSTTTLSTTKSKKPTQKPQPGKCSKVNKGRKYDEI